MSREITNSEAISNLNHIYGIVSSDIQRSLDLAIKVLEERPKGEWNYIQADMCVCPFCGAMPHKLYKNYCAKCGAEMKGGDKK